MDDLTKHLGEEETVALLEGDTLPVDIMLDHHSLSCRMRLSIGLGVPGVLVVGREASRVGGLGDLAVVDLLEGVEALARRRHGVHQMHIGGSFGGIEIFGVGIVSSVVVGSRAIFLSHEAGAGWRRKSGFRGEEPCQDC